MATGKSFLENAYKLDAELSAQEFYTAWSETYDTEISENGYATPTRCAEALAQFASDKSAPLLDFGCGTGVSGAAFKAAGFSVIDGFDVTAGMLSKAREKGLYRNLISAAPGEALPIEPGSYTHIAAVGSISPGHAPASTIDTLLAILPKGGCFVLSLSDHALADPAFRGRISEHLDCGSAELLMHEYGDHLPGIAMKTSVYVLRKR